MKLQHARHRPLQKAVVAAFVAAAAAFVWLYWAGPYRAVVLDRAALAAAAPKALDDASGERIAHPAPGKRGGQKSWKAFKRRSMEASPLMCARLLWSAP